MKNKSETGNRLLQRATGCVSILFILSTFSAHALDVIDPTGAYYMGVSDSSHFDNSYTAANLFNQDVTGVAVGTIISGSEYAKSGSGDSFVAFQLDQNYANIASIFYAQRNGYYADQDKVGIISIWSSDSTPFTAADPGTSPNSVIAITNTTGAQWTEYLMTNSISGQYFLIKLEQTSPGGNPGGTEFRLGANLGLPPTIMQSPENRTVYVGGTARFSVKADGTAPLTYFWALDSSPLSNGDRISGADTANLVVSDVASTDAGSYSVIVSNATDTISASASLTVLDAPTEAAETSVLSKGPRAFWQLNESGGSTTVLDMVGSFNGTYGQYSGVGENGPQPPDYPGFASDNKALRTYAFTTGSAATVPALNISTTNSVTLLAWIYQDSAEGPQQPYTGIVYCRGIFGQTSAGLICSSDGTKLAYQWGGNRYNFDTGLIIPTNRWTLVALVYTPSATTLYCGSSNGVVLSAVDNYAQGGQAFEVPMKIGLDTDAGESSRTFNGFIDDVAFFNRALSASEINSIYEAGTGITPTLEIISQSSTNLNVFQGQPINLSIQVSGLDPVFQWFKQDASISGATNNTYSIPHAAVSDSGSYYVVISNEVNSITSAVINVTVPDYVVLPIGPSGSLYSGISASSEYPNPNYVATNLFDSDLTGVAIGTHLTGKDWADDGYGTTFQPAYVAFELDQTYTAQAILYAQRNSQSGQTIDKITKLSVWASETTPFTASDPGTLPDAEVSVPEVDAANLHAYVLPASVTGRYFVVKFDQNPIVEGSNIGGNEFRLGTLVTTVPLEFSASPAGLTLTWPAAATLQQADDVNGPWVKATGVTSGVPVSPTEAKQFYRILYQ